MDRLFAKLLAKVSNHDSACTLTSLIKLYLSNTFRSQKTDIVLSTFRSISTACAATMLGRKKAPIKALYLMDPTDVMVSTDLSFKSESKWFIKTLKNTDIIFTTRFIKEAMLAKGYAELNNNIIEVSFPMITGFHHTSQNKHPDKITLFYGGSLYLNSNIRSPEYYFKIISHLDERFRIIFVGHESKAAVSKYNIKTSAEIICLPQMKHEDLLQTMADADILVNIGNSIPVHLPSKTLEYINTGKPIINFHKLDNCPTLHCTQKYPLCLNLDEKNADISSVVEKFISFCSDYKGKTLPQDWIQKTFFDSTPADISRQITEECLKLYRSSQSS